MNQDTLRRFGDILKIYSEQFELAFEEENIQDQLEYGITFMEDYPLRMKQVVDELLNYKVNKEVFMMKQVHRIAKVGEQVMLSDYQKWNEKAVEAMGDMIFTVTEMLDSCRLNTQEGKPLYHSWYVVLESE